MPANRRRTELWRQSLWQVFERGGALEISRRRPALEKDGAGTEQSNKPVDLVWRVRILDLSDDAIVVETPTTLGHSAPIDPGADLACVLAIGQNRWMFGSRVAGHVTHRAGRDRVITALRLPMPEQVERCQRRNFYRVSTLEINLPGVTCWPLLDPASAIVAEKANEVQITRAIERPAAAAEDKRRDGERAAAGGENALALPEVGPPFHATLSNLGGGGIGLIIEPGAAQSLTRHRIFWLRIALPPELPHPLALTARLVHTHIDSTQRTYAGFAFEFSHNRSHQQFVVDQFTRYAALQRREPSGALRANAPSAAGNSIRKAS